MYFTYGNVDPHRCGDLGHASYFCQVQVVPIERGSGGLKEVWELVAGVAGGELFHWSPHAKAPWDFQYWLGHVVTVDSIYMEMNGDNFAT